MRSSGSWYSNRAFHSPGWQYLAGLAISALCQQSKPCHQSDCCRWLDHRWRKVLLSLSMTYLLLSSHAMLRTMQHECVSLEMSLLVLNVNAVNITMIVVAVSGWIGSTSMHASRNHRLIMMKSIWLIQSALGLFHVYRFWGWQLKMGLWRQFHFLCARRSQCSFLSPKPSASMIASVFDWPAFAFKSPIMIFTSLDFYCRIAVQLLVKAINIFLTSARCSC